MIIKAAAVAVSYAHLDVYKIQAVHHNHGVAQLSACKVAAGVDLVVDDDAAANAGAQGDGCLLYTFRCV